MTTVSLPRPALRCLAACAALAMSLAATAATPAFIGYPAPGGNSASGSGAGVADAGGFEWTYSGFNPSAYGDLYYAIGNQVGGSFVPGWPTLTFDGTPDVLLFDGPASNLPGGVAVWSGTSVIYTTGLPQIAFTRFTLQVTDTTSAPLALVGATTVGLPAELGAVLDVAGSYRANWSFTASASPGGAYSPANDYFTGVANKLPGYQAQSSVNGAFYATPVPEPQAAALLLAGLAGMVWLRQRRRA
jgi:hypothetical protein